MPVDIGGMLLYGAGYIAAIVAFLIATARNRGRVRGTMALLLVLTIAFPFIQILFERVNLSWSAKRDHAIAIDARKRFQEICALPPKISVKKEIFRPEGTTILVREPPTLFGLDVTYPYPNSPLDKGVCWLPSGMSKCNLSNVTKVQWEYKSLGSWCTGKNPRPDCNSMVEFDLKTNEKRDIQRLTAEYVLDVSDYVLDVSVPEQLTGYIQKFKISVVDANNIEIAETEVYRMREIEQPFYMLHCPNRDQLIGDLLGKVFPLRAK